MSKPSDKKPAKKDDFASQLAAQLCGALADAAADGGEAGDAYREAKYKHVTPLYAGVKPPELNEDGSLADPDAGPPGSKSDKKTKKDKK